MINDEIQADIQKLTQDTNCEDCKTTKVKFQFAQSQSSQVLLGEYGSGPNQIVETQSDDCWV